jgi:hypothetical protein
MSILRLETGEPIKITKCECCGADFRWIHGFVYRNDDAHAIYYAGWSDGHPDRGVTMAIAVGEWSDDSSPADRVSIGIVVVPTPSSLNFTVLEPHESPWEETSLFGKMLERNRALAQPVLPHVMHIAEHVVHDDARVRGFLDSFDEPPPPG